MEAATVGNLEGSGLALKRILQRQGAVIALLLLLIAGGLRYDGFLSFYNVTEMLRYNAMFGLIALGMTFVIVSGGIDLSVGATVALASVLAARMSEHGFLAALFIPVLAGILIGLVNGWLIAKISIPPFIATLATLMGVRGLALIFAGRNSVSVDTASGLSSLGLQGICGALGVAVTRDLPIPLIILVLAFGAGAFLLNVTVFGRHVLAIGGGEDAARLMGLPVEWTKLKVYAMSGALAALAGVLLAAQTLSGLPTEGVGWELTAIASVVVGGTLLSGGEGSILSTLAGVLLLGVLLNLLNFMNLSAYWQSTVRGLFLLIVVIMQSRRSQV